MTWDVREFKSLLDACRSGERAAQASSAAEALVHDTEFAAYHASRSAEIMKSVELPRGLANDSRGVAALRQLGWELEPGKRDRPLMEARFESSAHMIACFRSLHAATDLLAPVVYFSLNLPVRLPKPLSENALYPDRVLQRLQEFNLYPNVADRLNELLSSPAYIYIRALVNTTKHREMVPTGFTISLDFSSDPKHGIRIGRFTYRGHTYEPVWSSDFLATERRPLIEAMIRIGNALNSELRSECGVESQPA